MLINQPFNYYVLDHLQLGELSVLAIFTAFIALICCLVLYGIAKLFRENIPLLTCLSIGLTTATIIYLLTCMFTVVAGNMNYLIGSSELEFPILSVLSLLVGYGVLKSKIKISSTRAALLTILAMGVGYLLGVTITILCGALFFGLDGYSAKI